MASAQRTGAWIAIFFAVATAVFVVACRQEDPMGDPKTPANSPLPKLEPKEPDTKPSRLPSLGDAG